VAEPSGIYQFAGAPVRIGAPEEILGSVQIGLEIDDAVAGRLQEETGSEVSFFVDGQLIASSLTIEARAELRNRLKERGGLPKGLSGSEPFTVRLGDRQYLSLAQPLDQGSRQISYLIQKSLSDALQPYRAIQQSLLGIGVLGLLCAVVVSFAVAGGIADPLLRIVGAAEALGRGDWSQRVEWSASDEVGVLARAFNGMAARLESWDADLRGAVAERTSELNAAVQRLDAAFDQMRRFNADASHELRTPLTIVRGEAEVALRSNRSSVEYEAVLQSILEETERMGRIIDTLLLLARADAGEVALERSRVALHELLYELQPSASVLARRNRLELAFEIQAPVFVRGDAFRLHQLFLNLLDNATKYTPAGGTVRVTATREGDRAVVRVADTGLGIRSEHLPHLFDRFFRADKARSREMGGCGLGLSICKWIVDAHEGAITVRSTPGEGSVFEVSFPLDTSVSAREPQPIAESPVRTF
jgi:signal transduction histidine kinase